MFYILHRLLSLKRELLAYSAYEFQVTFDDIYGNILMKKWMLAEKYLGESSDS